ncbi:MAG: glycosyltransferase, partial [Chloroflexota bacterium]
MGQIGSRGWIKADQVELIGLIGWARVVNGDHIRVLQHPFENFTAQKSYALSQSTNDWTLFLDADEVVTPDLKEEILSTIQSPDPCEAYWFYRKFMFKNEPLHFSGWQTDKNHRLFRKSKAKYTDKKIVHE